MSKIPCNCKAVMVGETNMPHYHDEVTNNDVSPSGSANAEPLRELAKESTKSIDDIIEELVIDESNPLDHSAMTRNQLRAEIRAKLNLNSVDIQSSNVNKTDQSVEASE